MQQKVLGCSCGVHNGGVCDFGADSWLVILVACNRNSPSEGHPRMEPKLLACGDASGDAGADALGGDASGGDAGADLAAPTADLRKNALAFMICKTSGEPGKSQDPAARQISGPKSDAASWAAGMQAHRSVRAVSGCVHGHNGCSLSRCATAIVSWL